MRSTPPLINFLQVKEQHFLFIFIIFILVEWKVKHANVVMLSRWRVKIHFVSSMEWAISSFFDVLGKQGIIIFLHHRDAQISFFHETTNTHRTVSGFDTYSIPMPANALIAWLQHPGHTVFSVGESMCQCQRDMLSIMLWCSKKCHAVCIDPLVLQHLLHQSICPIL